MSAAILSVATSLPEHRLRPADALARLRAYFPQLDRLEETDATLGTRYTCEPVDKLLASRGLTDLGEAYLRHARRLALNAALKALDRAGLTGRDIDLVIAVSCTGYLVPSLDVYMAEELGFRRDVLRLPITELGCSAGAAGIAAAHRHLAGFPDDHVLVVAVEVPSLSFHGTDRSLDNLTACLVFGDGAGAAVLGKPGKGRVDHLEVVRAASYLVPGTAGVLGFDLRDSGFHVVLDRRLPRILASELRRAVESFLEAGEMPRPAFYAVHAAGSRIFDAAESALSLPPGSLDVSRKVFDEVGNTSSAAIFFALEKLLGQPATERQDGLGLGIGPGITLELMHLARVPAQVDLPNVADSLFPQEV